MEAYFVYKAQLLDLDQDKVRKKEDMEVVKLDGIDVPIWQKKNGLCMVPQ